MLAPRSFAATCSPARSRARHVSVGQNFRFGHGATRRRRLPARRPEFETEVVPLVEARRRAGVLQPHPRALVERATWPGPRDCSARPYQLEGKVVRGRRARPRRSACRPPTSMPPADVVVPGAGVYAGSALGRCRPRSTSASGRRSRRDGELIVEAYLLDFDGDLYGRARCGSAFWSAFGTSSASTRPRRSWSRCSGTSNACESCRRPSSRELLLAFPP